MKSVEEMLIDGYEPTRKNPINDKETQNLLIELIETFYEREGISPDNGDEWFKADEEYATAHNAFVDRINDLFDSQDRILETLRREQSRPINTRYY